MDSKKTNILYHALKYIAMYTIFYYLTSLPNLHHKFISVIIFILGDYLVIKLFVINQLNNQDKYYIKKRALDLPFIIITTIYLIGLFVLNKTPIHLNVIVVVVHILMFKAIKVPKEEIESETNNFIKNYFKKKGK